MFLIASQSLLKSLNIVLSHVNKLVSYLGLDIWLSYRKFRNKLLKIPELKLACQVFAFLELDVSSFKYLPVRDMKCCGQSYLNSSCRLLEVFLSCSVLSLWLVVVVCSFNINKLC